MVPKFLSIFTHSFVISSRGVKNNISYIIFKIAELSFASSIFFRAADLPDMSPQKKERDLKRQEKKDKLLALAKSFQARPLRNRRPVSYNYCKDRLC